MIPTTGSETRFRKPVLYQKVSGVQGPEFGVQNINQDSKYETGNSSTRHPPLVARHFLAGLFTLDAQNRVHFAVGLYNHCKPLIIDPVLAFTASNATFIPYPINSGASGVAADSGGNVYLVGATNSSTLPVVNPLPPPNNAMHGTSNLVVAKMNSTGTALVCSTYLGVSGSDSSGGIAVDSNGFVYVAGATTSTDFPTASGAYQTSLAGTRNAFVTQLNASGDAILHSSYLGGTASDGGAGVGVAPGAVNNVFVAGTTSSTNFPITAGVFQTTKPGLQNVFVSEFSTTLSGPGSLVYPTYLGGSTYDSAFGIGVDSSGNATVTGTTSSNNFPTSNAYQAGRGQGEETAFVTKLNSTGTALVYSTFLARIIHEAAPNFNCAV